MPTHSERLAAIRRQAEAAAAANAARAAATRPIPPRPGAGMIPTDYRSVYGRGVAGDVLMYCMDQASQNIWEAVHRGDLATSRWLVDRLHGTDGTRVPMAMAEAQLPSDPVEAADALTRAATEGLISLEVADKLLTLVERRAALQSANEIAVLRAMVDKLVGITSASTIDGQPQSQHPAWLKLRAARPEPDIGPAINDIPTDEQKYPCE